MAKKLCGSIAKPEMTKIKLSVFRPIECAGYRIHVTDTDRDTDFRKFATTRADELRRELQILTLENPDAAESSLCRSLIQALALARVWKRYKDGDDDWGKPRDQRPKPPKPRLPSLGKRILERV